MVEPHLAQQVMRRISGDLKISGNRPCAGVQVPWLLPPTNNRSVGARSLQRIAKTWPLRPFVQRVVRLTKQSLHQDLFHSEAGAWNFKVAQRPGSCAELQRRKLTKEPKRSSCGPSEVRMAAVEADSRRLENTHCCRRRSGLTKNLRNRQSLQRQPLVCRMHPLPPAHAAVRN